MSYQETDFSKVDLKPLMKITEMWMIMYWRGLQRSLVGMANMVCLRICSSSFKQSNIKLC